MTPFEKHFEELRAELPGASALRLPSGAHLIEVPNYQLRGEWNQNTATVLFIAPPGYPGAQPDCFWLEPKSIRLKNGQMPDRANDANGIPEVGNRSGVWFSWHVQQWSPNRDNLMVYFKVIEQRLFPAR